MRRNGTRRGRTLERNFYFFLSKRPCRAIRPIGSMSSRATIAVRSTRARNRNEAKVFREELVDDTIERPVYFRSPILLLLPSLIDNNREKYASRSAKFSPNSNSRWIDENRRDVWTRCAFTLGGLVGGGISRIIGGICRARGFFNFAIEQSRWTNNGPVNIAIRPNPISKPERTINDTRWGEESWPREVKIASRR